MSECKSLFENVMLELRKPHPDLDQVETSIKVGMATKQLTEDQCVKILALAEGVMLKLMSQEIRHKRGH